MATAETEKCKNKGRRGDDNMRGLRIDGWLFISSFSHLQKCHRGT